MPEKSISYIFGLLLLSIPFAFIFIKLIALPGFAMQYLFKSLLTWQLYYALNLFFNLLCHFYFLCILNSDRNSSLLISFDDELVHDFWEQEADDNVIVFLLWKLSCRVVWNKFWDLLMVHEIRNHCSYWELSIVLDNNIGDLKDP